MEKAALRQRLRARRRALGRRADGTALAAILHEATAAAAAAGTELVAGFLPTPQEPDVLAYLTLLRRDGVRVVVPRTLPGRAMEWVDWSPDSPLAEDRHGLQAPTGPGDPTVAGSLRIMLVPALAIDRAGHRLGQGGGYYDRALQRLPRWPEGPLRIGVVHPEGLLDESVPHAPHDEPVDVAACATGWRFTAL